MCQQIFSVLVLYTLFCLDTSNGILSGSSTPMGRFHHLAIIVVNVKHLRIAQFVNQRNAFSHHAHAIDRIDNGLCFRIEDVSSYYRYVVHVVYVKCFDIRAILLFLLSGQRKRY